jgi:hypothetical protein
MSTEKPSVGELIKVLKECNKDNDFIIETLKNIIQTKMMYGGEIQDSIDFHIYSTRAEYNKLK